MSGKPDSIEVAALVADDCRRLSEMLGSVNDEVPEGGPRRRYIDLARQSIRGASHWLECELKSNDIQLG